MKMTKLILLVALPGSGKTYFGTNNTPENGVFIDDICDFSLLQKASTEYETVMVSDPKLCDDEVRRFAKQKIHQTFSNVKIEWVFWENNPTKSFKNVCLRNDGREISQQYIEELSSKYHPPKVDMKIYETT